MTGVMMVGDMKIIAVVLILAALVYILYLWSKRKDQIPCPSCGARVNIYAEECPHCGHRKGEPVKDDTTTDQSPADEVAEDVGGAVDMTSSAPASEAAGVNYTDVVQGTIPDVKHRVMEEDLDVGKVLEAEQANKDRVTLKDWLNDQLAEQ